MALSNADRQREFRERKRRELQEQLEAEELAAVVAKLENVEIDAALGKPPPRSLPISEEEYVRLSLAEPNILDRRRAARYARWRYRGVLAGKVAAL